MSVTAAFVAQTSPSSRSAPTRDPPRLRILAAVLTVAVAGLFIRNGDSLVATLVVEWRSLVFWAVLIALVSIFPIKVDDALLTVDEPILLALAILYPPEVAALVALMASVDVREFKGQLAFARALFNHMQVGLSVYLAAEAFRLVTGGNLAPWPIAAIGTGVAVSAEYLTNVFLVSLHARVRWGLDLTGAVRKLKVGQRSQFLATYLGYGSLALVLVHLFRFVGAWSTVAFLVPILVARQMLVRGEELQALSEKLRSRDRLLKKVSDRIVDERRDERSRLAGDLHDEVLQTLTQIWLSARILEKQQKATGHVLDEVRDLVRVSEGCIESFRRVIHDLKDWPDGWAGLIPTLEGLIRDLRIEWKKSIQLNAPDVLEVETSTQFVIYQIVREAIVNSLKHARASLIRVLIEVSNREITLSVEDDGVGFSLETVESTSHFGLRLMGERSRSVGGAIHISSERGRGTQITARFPK
jgi:signal transduction histidine kinase